MTWLLRTLTAALLTTATLTAADIKLNDEYTGKLPATKSTLPVKGGNTYVEMVTVNLESDHKITVTARGAGNRILALAVFDKENNLIGKSFEVPRLQTRAGVKPQASVATQFAVATGGKASSLKADFSNAGKLSFTAPADGEYTIMVISNLSGVYKMTVADPKAK